MQQNHPKVRQRFFVLPLLALAAVLVPSAVLASSAEGSDNLNAWASCLAF